MMIANSPWTLEMLVSRWVVDSIRRAFLALKPDKGKTFEALIRAVSDNARERYQKAKEIVNQIFFKVLE